MRYKKGGIIKKRKVKNRDAKLYKTRKGNNLSWKDEGNYENIIEDETNLG